MGKFSVWYFGHRPTLLKFVSARSHVLEIIANGRAFWTIQWKRMRDARQTLEQYFLEMRWRCLSLAADLDRVERSPGGPELLSSDPRLKQLREAIGVLLDGRTNRAEQVQTIFSDKTPPPARNPKSGI